MIVNRASLLKKIAESSATAGGNNIRDGKGRLAIRKMSIEDGYKGTRFVTEFVVVSSQKIPVVELKTGKALDIEPNATGTEADWVQMLDQHESALGNVKNFVLRLFGENEDTTSNAELIESLSELTEKNSACGMVIDYETYRKVSKKNQVEMILQKWSSVTQTPEDIQKMRTWIESLALAGKEAQEVSARA